ncbi:hypothetical protein [uncultured Stenotrophomonas sp.]|uniref:hypothetical protein n=1 Tax=uncultured Stenotrophomonas sp. TaxID=165438 RepID=UPI0025F75863|nr:hypothetical protein [uncultured Stenotrophomonas sp.]
MKIFAIISAFYLAVLIMSMPALVRSRQGGEYYASVTALVLLAVAPVFLTFFAVNSAPYFNLYIPVAILAGLLYLASFLSSVASIFLYLGRARGSFHLPER